MAHSLGTPIVPAQPLRAARKQQIAGVLAALAASMPAWAPLLSLPVRYARLYPDGGAISACVNGASASATSPGVA